MTTPNLFEADNTIRAELELVSRELGNPWQIEDYTPLQDTSGEKGYAAKAGARLVYDNRSSWEIATILFRPDDATGNWDYWSSRRTPKQWTTRIKNGEAEFYISLGSNVDGQWLSGLTCLDAKKFDERSDTKVCTYKHLTARPNEYFSALRLRNNLVSPRRFDFTYDRHPIQGEPYGLSHAVGFDSLSVDAKLFDVEYQIGAFVSFSQPCTELDILREKAREGGTR